MIKLKLIEEIIRKDRDLQEVEVLRERIDTVQANSSYVSFDPERIRLNFGTRSLYIFGRTDNNVWIYFLTIYEHTGEPAGPLFWALPGSEEEVLSHIKSHLGVYKRGEKT